MNFLHGRILWRRIRRTPLINILNLVGLSLGLAVAILASLYIQNELSYDRDHRRAADIYRVTTKYMNAQGVVAFRAAATPAGMSVTMREELPSVELAVRIAASRQSRTVRHDERIGSALHIAYVDSGYFELFPQEIIAGDPKAALRTPGGAVITEAVANEYFPDGNALGKELVIDGRNTANVMAIRKSYKYPSNLYDYPIIMPWSDMGVADNPNWIYNISYLTFIRLAPGTDIQHFKTQFGELLESHMGDILRNAGAWMECKFEPLQQVHFSNIGHPAMKPPTSPMYLILMGVIGLFALVIAVLNYINLTTAKSMEQGRFVGIVKTFGASRPQLTRLFFAESVTLALVAFVLSLVLVALGLPKLEQILNVKLVLDIQRVAVFLGIAFVFTVITGLLAGVYPALAMSSFRPVSMLRGQFVSGTRGKRVRSTLVVIQFVLALFLIVSAFQISHQIDYMVNSDLGYNRDKVMMVRLANWDQMTKSKTFEAMLHRIPGVAETSESDYTIESTSSSPFHISGTPIDDQVQLSHVDVGFGYLEFVKARLIEGRFFDPEIASDSTKAAILTRSAMEKLGWSTAIGKTVDKYTNLETMEVKTYNVIGVIEDIRYGSLHGKVRPLFLRALRGHPPYIFVRFRGNDLAASVRAVHSAWEEFAPGFVFQSVFLDNVVQNWYSSEFRLDQAFSILALLSSLIAAMGLFGLSVFAIEKRTREIGIRRVLGATTTQILALMTSEIVLLVAIANLVAFPATAYLMTLWMGRFDAHAPLSWTSFLLGGAISFVLALLIVGGKSLMATQTNPAEVLHHE